MFLDASLVGAQRREPCDELDACAGAFAAYMLASGGGSWVGDPLEGVIVLPVDELLARYDPLPPPARVPLA